MPQAQPRITVQAVSMHLNPSTTRPGRKRRMQGVDTTAVTGAGDGSFSPFESFRTGKLLCWLRVHCPCTWRSGYKCSLEGSQEANELVGTLAGFRFWA